MLVLVNTNIVDWQFSWWKFDCHLLDWAGKPLHWTFKILIRQISSLTWAEVTQRPHWTTEARLFSLDWQGRWPPATDQPTGAQHLKIDYCVSSFRHESCHMQSDTFCWGLLWGWPKVRRGPGDGGGPGGCGRGESRGHDRGARGSQGQARGE